MSENEGVYGKYIIAKADGTPVDPMACYFVLRLDRDGHARTAMRLYADTLRACQGDNPLSSDITAALDALQGLASSGHIWRHHGAQQGETMEDYHPSIAHLMQFFTFAHLPEHLQKISKPVAIMAETMAASLPSNPELTAGLRKLLEAKDCFVRARLVKEE